MSTIASTVYATTDTPLGNGAFTADGRLVVSHHPMYGTPHRVSVFGADGVLAPFPNFAWNAPGGDPMGWLDAVLGLHDDSQGRIWMADMGTRSDIPPKLVVWDTKRDRLWRIIPLPPKATTRHSEPNDFVVDEARGKVYIADEGAGRGGDGSRAALIVLDIATGQAQRRLEGCDGIRAEPQPLVIDGRVVERNGADGSRTALHVGVDGIAMDDAGEWLYLSPLNGHALWRVRVADLLDPALDDPALARRLERYADKPNSGGMVIDAAGDIYLTCIETNAIGRVSAIDRSYDQPVVRPDMFWPDGLMRGPDGALYVVVTQLPRSPALARPGERPVLPFKVFRFEPRPRAAAGPAGDAPAFRPARRDSGGASRLLKLAVMGAAAGVMGAAAGVLAAAATSVFQSAWHQAGLPPAPSVPPEPEPTKRLAVEAFRAATGKALSRSEAEWAGALIHYATGAGLGAAYALLAQRSPQIRAGRGAAYGLGVWATIEEMGLALAGLKPPPWSVEPAEHLLAASSHLVFGVSLDAALSLCSDALAAKAPSAGDRPSI